MIVFHFVLFRFIFLLVVILFSCCCLLLLFIFLVSCFLFLVLYCIFTALFYLIHLHYEVHFYHMSDFMEYFRFLLFKIVIIILFRFSLFYLAFCFCSISFFSLFREFSALVADSLLELLCHQRETYFSRHACSCLRTGAHL